jgi:hypothetical protein
LTLRPGSEFNPQGVMTPQRQLELETLAVNGGSVASVFAISAERAGLTEKGRAAREKKDAERHREVVRAMMASEERMAAFQKKLDELEIASYEALVEIDDRLRDKRQGLERMRANAFKLEKPDGTVMRVYRDKNEKVRDDNGNFVSEELVRAEDIGDGFTRWEPYESEKSDIEDLERDREKVAAYHARVGSAREELSRGGVSDDRRAELDAELGDVPAAVQSKWRNPPAAERAEDQVPASKIEGIERRAETTPHQGVSTPGPG